MVRSQRSEVSSRKSVVGGSAMVIGGPSAEVGELNFPARKLCGEIQLKSHCKACQQSGIGLCAGQPSFET
jgi:hypothetical protein